MEIEFQNDYLIIYYNKFKKTLYLNNINKCKYNIKTKHPKILTDILIYSFTTRIKKKYKLK